MALRARGRRVWVRLEAEVLDDVSDGTKGRVWHARSRDNVEDERLCEKGLTPLVLSPR